MASQRGFGPIICDMPMAYEKHFLRRGTVFAGQAWGAALLPALLASACGSDTNGSGAAAANGGTGSTTTLPNNPDDTGMNEAPGDTSPSDDDTPGAEDPMNIGGLMGNGGSDMEPVGAGPMDPIEEDPEVPEMPAMPDPRPFFSFFVTSQAGLYGLPAGDFAPAPDPALGYGGDLGGLAGADEICSMLAQAANPGDNKTWRAFLSTSGFDGEERVDAIDRVGPGPWFDYNGLKLADDVAGLLPEGDDGRPQGADAQLADMFTDENGEDIRPSQQIDNHDTLTGSGPDGRLFDDGEDGEIATCEDWTSSTVRGDQGNAMGNGGQVPVGHSWPRSDNNGRQWINDHTINGCEPGFDVDGGAGAPAGDFRVGAGGGYGGIYCFALGAVAPGNPN